MYRRKQYGQSKIENCPFCSKTATSVNKQGLPVCLKHKSSYLPALKCVCGETLDLKSGKFGPYFTCMNCGNMNFKKVMEINPNIDVPEEESKSNSNTKTYQKKKTTKEITVTSDELDFM